MFARILFIVGIALASSHLFAAQKLAPPPEELRWQLGESPTATFIAEVCNQPARYCHAFVTYLKDGVEVISYGVCRTPIGQKACPSAEECVFKDKSVAFSLEKGATRATVSSEPASVGQTPEAGAGE